MTNKEPPEGLSEKSRKIWLKINRNYELEYEHMILLKVALESLDLMIIARKCIDEQGIQIKQPSGFFRNNPALTVYKDSRNGFLQAWKQLGLPPEENENEVGRPPGGIY